MPTTSKSLLVAINRKQKELKRVIETKTRAINREQAVKEDITLYQGRYYECLLKEQGLTFEDVLSLFQSEQAPQEQSDNLNADE
jgi:hypothetical protein